MCLESARFWADFVKNGAKSRKLNLLLEIICKRTNWWRLV